MYEDPQGVLKDKPARGVVSYAFEDIDEAMVQANAEMKKVDNKIKYWAEPIFLMEPQ